MRAIFESIFLKAFKQMSMGCGEVRMKRGWREKKWVEHKEWKGEHEEGGGA